MALATVELTVSRLSQETEGMRVLRQLTDGEVDHVYKNLARILVDHNDVPRGTGLCFQRASALDGPVTALQAESSHHGPGA